MAFHRTLANRFFHMAKACASHLRPTRPALPDNVTRHFLLKDPTRMQQLLNGSRIQLDGLIPPQIPKETISTKEEFSMKEVRKVLKAAQMEMVRTMLKKMEKDRISYDDFMSVCGGVSGLDQGVGVARALDESGDVIVLGNVVFLRPDQVAKAVESAIPMSISPKKECHRDELRELEEKKAVIDKLAETGVKKELWCGLGFMVLQTAGLMRLTFWELSWDVMEPICFYLTSTYFLAGYGFFLGTSREPSFESFFKSRFDTKQKQLMKAHAFDLSRFNELKKDGCDTLASYNCDCSKRGMEVGIVH